MQPARPEPNLGIATARDDGHLPSSNAAEYHRIYGTAVEIEYSLIGACLMHRSALDIALATLIAEYFAHPLHQTLWRAISELAADGRTVSPVTLIAKLGNEKAENGSTLGQYLASSAADSYAPDAHTLELVKQVREYWALRQVAALNEEARRAALVPGTSAKNLICDLILELDQTRAALQSRPLGGRMIADDTSLVLDRMNRIITGEITDRFITTGLQDLDRKLGGGFRPGQLIIIAGRPGMGKTTVAVSLCRQMAKAGHAGGFFSLEMTSDQISARFISDEAFGHEPAINANQILSGQVEDGEAERVLLAGRTFHELPLALDDSAGLTVGEIRARTCTMKDRFERAGRKLEFIAIDYLKFVRVSERYRGNRNLEIGEITAGLKGLAKDLDIAVILLCQLNREIEKTTSRRPELSHLRDSGEIEQDADVVLFLFREIYYLVNDPRCDPDRLSAVQNQLEIICAKQRMGSTGALHVFCHPGASAVRDLRRVS